MRKSTSLAVLLTTLALGACGSTTNTASTSTERPDTTTPGSTAPSASSSPDTTPATTGTTGTVDVSALVDRDWRAEGMVTVGGIQPVPDGSTASLHFTDNGDGSGTVAVDTGCNTGSADVTYSAADELTIGPIALTKKACTDELNALETSLVALLEHPQSWGVDGDTLKLLPLDITDSGLQLRDEAATAPTTVPTGDTAPGRPDDEMQRLLDTKWIPERFITVGPLDRIPSGSGASVRFENATTIAINTGCNQGTGTVAFRADGTFTVTDLVTTEIACDDNGLEVRILSLFEHPLQWGIDADTLTIYPIDVSDTGMILRDADAIAAEPATTATAQDIVAADRAAIIAASAVARRDSAGLDFTEIAIVEKLGTSGADGMVVFGPADVALTDAERAAVEAALAPVTVRWVVSIDEPALQAATAAGQVDAVITLSDPAVEGDAATMVTGIYCGFPEGLCGTGGGVTLDRQIDGSWKVGESFGPVWEA